MQFALLAVLVTVACRVNFDPVGGPSIPACDPSAAGLAACWDFDGSTLDSSPFHNNAVASAISFVPGRRAMAVHLDVASSITVPEAPSLDFTSEMTIMAWVRPDALPSPGERAVVFDNNRQYGFYVAPQGVGCIATGSVASTSALTLGQWSHIACTVQGTTITIYVDGMLAAKTSNVAAFITTGNEGSRIGGNIPDPMFSGPEPLTGDLDELQLYATALSAEAICIAAGVC